MTHIELSSAICDAPPFVCSCLPPIFAKYRMPMTTCSQRWHYNRILVLILHPFFFQFLPSPPKVAFSLPMSTLSLFHSCCPPPIDCKFNTKNIYRFHLSVINHDLFIFNFVPFPTFSMTREVIATDRLKENQIRKQFKVELRNRFTMFEILEGTEEIQRNRRVKTTVRL